MPISGHSVFAVEMFQYLPVRLIRSFAGPDGEDVIDRLREHGAAVAIEKFECLGIGTKDAGADPEQ